ncbi:CDP-diacylglycerol/serine O-phosphatidyltransferase [Candidatus Magnetoovum chiemensis]|nr:CDP-diacylglycerol/serine O-phosphatidyltransferase [Candidatus Magnetoovum chiemensis]
MKSGVYLLPNGLTLCGMFFGFYSIVSSLNGEYVTAGWAILIANIFDGLDGWVARLTNTTSRFGIELDSLSDLVAFGVAPSVMIFNGFISPFGRIGLAVAFLYLSCGALRLARYNIQMVSTEKKYFTGMPIPAAATVLSTAVIFYNNQLMVQLPIKSFFILILTIVLSFIMISTLRYHGLKEFDLKKRKPFPILFLLLALGAIVAIHPQFILFLLAILYLIWGIIENSYLFYNRKKAQRKTAKESI